MNEEKERKIFAHFWILTCLESNPGQKLVFLKTWLAVGTNNRTAYRGNNFDQTSLLSMLSRTVLFAEFLRIDNQKF